MRIYSGRGSFLRLIMMLTGIGYAAESTDFQNVMVRPGDTLWSISNKYLKNPERWNEILKHNRLLSSDPTVALPGMTLRVPVKLIKEEMRAARLIYRLNNVLYRRQETADWKNAPDNMELFRNDSLRTLESSKARVKFLNQDLLQLDANSMAVIKPINKDYDVELKQGGVFVGRARVVTASARITPRTPDTKYSATVGQDLSTKVEVFSGKAAVEAQGETVEVTAGMESNVKMGLAPDVPTKIPNLPDFEARAAEFSGNFQGLRSKAVVSGQASEPKAARGPAAGGVRSMEDIKDDVDLQRIGQPISGYRIQFSASDDFSNPVYERIFDADALIKPGDVKLPAGRYWVRIALIDLLGTQGRFSQPRQYTVGGAR